jgi:predicted nucleic acid-binding protein
MPRAVAFREAAVSRTISLAEDVSALGSAVGSFVPLPNSTPFLMLDVYRLLRDAIPDISDAVWTWKRLCQTGYDTEILEPSSDVAERRAQRLLRELDVRVNGGDRGMDGLLDVLYGSLFTFGAAALEIVLSPSRESIHDVVPVDVWTVRFRRENGRLQAYQVHEGNEIALPMERFLYVGLDRDGTNPYGRSMLRSIPFVIKIQQRLMEDMSKALHNAGWAKLHVKYAPESRQRGESVEAYEARLARNFEQLRDKLNGLEADQNLVTYDNVSVELLCGDQRSQVFYENHKAIEEQVITGMHLMPILLGRNYGTTETYGTAQFEIVNRQVEAVNRSVKRILERLYNFELALMWGEARARVHMRSNRTVDALKAANARSREIANAVVLRNEGFVDQAGAAKELGYGL